MNTQKALGLSAILAATIMNLLDSTVVNVAAPSIQEDIGATYSHVQWIAAAYTLALAVGLLTGGRLGDMYGRRRMLVTGIVGFVGASLACAAATGPATLVGARVLQGLFAAVLLPQTFGLLRDLFGPQEMGKAFAIFGPAIGLSTILGPVVAGALTELGGWRLVFGINLPLGAFALIAGLRALPAGRGDRTVRLDGLGALLAGTGMLMLVYPLVQGRDLGWPAWTFALAAASAVMLGAFVITQRRPGRRRLVELSVLTKRSYASGLVFVIVFFGALVGFSLAVGLLLQLGLGYSPMRASLTMTAWAVGAFVGSGLSATMMRGLGRRILHIGLSIMAVALIGLYAVSSTSQAPGGLNLVLPLLAFGLGMGMIFVPLFDIILGEVRDHEVGSASSILESIQQLGASLGIAVLGSVFFSTVGGRADVATFVEASRRVTLLTIVLIAIAFALGFLLPQRARQVAPAAQPMPEPALA